MEENKRKKAPNSVLTIVCVVLILVFLVGCIVCIVNFKQGGYQSGAGVPEQVKNTNKNVEVAEDKPEEIEDEEINLDVDPSTVDYVSVADYKPSEELAPEATIGDTTYKLADIKAPYVELESSYADKVNKEIKGLYDEAVAVYKDGLSDSMSYVAVFEYKSYLNGEILSLVIETAYGATDVPYSKFYVYNFNVKDGSEVTEKDIGNKFNLTEEELKDKIWEAISEEHKKQQEKYPVESATIENDDTKKYFDEGKYQVFIGEDDNLSVVARFSSPAGRGYFDEVITL